ncbi:MAG TPA: hypothetical protein VFF30_06555 [Nitrososphaerales archaeon]|nr:hypothetical protein [Nitrososphaerales archaeon]
MKVSQFRKRVCINDLHSFFSDILLLTKRKSIMDVSREDLESALQKDLLHEIRNYEFYFGPYMVAGIPCGVELGYGELRPLEELSANARDYISSDRRYHSENGNKVKPAADWAKKDWFLRLQVKTIGWIDAMEKAQLGAKRAINAYELVTESAEFSKGFIDSFGFLPDSGFYMLSDTTEEKQHYRIVEVPHFIGRMPNDEQAVDDMTLILRKYNPSELEQRIIAAIDTFGMITENTPLNVKFMLKVIAMEAPLCQEMIVTISAGSSVKKLRSFLGRISIGSLSHSSSSRTSVSLEILPKI